MAVYQLSWSAPTTRSDGTELPADQILGYEITRIFGGNTTIHDSVSSPLLLDIGEDSSVGTLTIVAIDYVGARSVSVPVPNVILYNNIPVLSVKLTSMSVRVIATDVDGDSLSTTILTQGTKGVATVSNSSTGIVEYTPNNGQTGDDTFVVQISDGRVGGTVTQSVTVNITNWRVIAGSLDITIARSFS